MALVETEDRGAVRHLILNRPEKRNAMHGELVLAIGAALQGGRERRRRSTASSCAARARCSPPGWTSPRSAALSEAPQHLRAFRREVPRGMEPSLRR